MSEKIHIEGKEISIKRVNEQDYISLTDMSNWDDSEYSRNRIANWLKNRNTLDFLTIWERDNNPNFNYSQMEVIKMDAPKNSFAISPKAFIEKTSAMGIVSKAGRYGGTYGHVDIAFEFGSWLNAEFKYRLIKEFKRLRSEEMQRQRLQWNAGRELARLNYPIQTAAIQEVSSSLTEKKRGGAYASEADLINELVFGMTAKQWRAKNPDLKGNLRDNANTLQNVLIANLENLNAYLLKNGASYEARRQVLAKTVADQSEVLNQKYLPE
ncbi:MAG: KilA-N domain-containing protein [Bacteroidota bacterium]